MPFMVGGATFFNGGLLEKQKQTNVYVKCIPPLNADLFYRHPVQR